MSKDKVCFAMGSDKTQRLFNTHLYKVLMDRSPIPIYNREMDSWWDKPYVIQDALQYFERVIWIDNDIEIRSEKFFDLVDYPATMACMDGPMTYTMNKIQFNTGLVIIDSEHTEKWLANLDRDKRSDQECFPTENVDLLDMRFNWLRLMGTPNTPIYAYHWTGPVGKEEYKERIISGKNMYGV